jgi:hypothetical protein
MFKHSAGTNCGSALRGKSQFEAAQAGDVASSDGCSLMTALRRAMNPTFVQRGSAK